MSTLATKEVPQYVNLVKQASSLIKNILPSPNKSSYDAAELVVIGVYEGLQEVLSVNPKIKVAPELAVTRLLEAEQSIRALYTVYTDIKCFGVTLDGWTTVVCGVETLAQATVIAQLEAIIHNRSYTFISSINVTCHPGV